MSSAADHLLYALGWASFGLAHSVLAADSVKRRLGFGRYHRLAYNAFALLHFGAVWWLGREILSAAPLPGPGDGLRWAGDAVSLAGLAVIAVALAGYDRGRLLGTAQIRRPEAAEDEALQIAGLHRYVRHPLYSGLFMVLWGQAQTEFALATAVWGSVYLVIGTVYEERRLNERYGAAYRDYRSRVPAFIPWRGRSDPA